MTLLDEGMKNIKADVAADATNPYLIVLDGMDNVFLHPNIIKVIDYCNKKNTGNVYIHSSFPAVVEKIRELTDWSKLKVLKGERRHPSRDNWFNLFLKDQMSTRLYQKQINARMQTLLEKGENRFQLSLTYSVNNIQPNTSKSPGKTYSPIIPLTAS